MNIVEQYRPERLPLAQACDALIIHRSSVYARRIAATAKPKDDARCRQHAPQPRALTPEENTQVLNTLRSERFKDQPPAQIYYQLMQGGEYLCSISTMHRRLREHGENGERRNQRPAQHHAVPQLVAQNPNEVWSWDITKLPLMQRGVFLSLYVVIDLYSRFVIAWMLSRKENSALAQQLMSEAIDRYPEAAGKLAIHQDRGSPMIAQGFLDTLGDLGATATHNRPRVSNDNPFSESQFKTLKYQPDYPGRFESYAHAEHWCAEYFDWYNNDHHHSSLAGFTPEQVFSGRYRELAKEREKTMRAAYERNPERFVKGPPKVALPPQVVAINPIYREDGSIETESGVNLPTLSKVREANLH